MENVIVKQASGMKAGWLSGLITVPLTAVFVYLVTIFDAFLASYSIYPSPILVLVLVNIFSAILVTSEHYYRKKSKNFEISSRYYLVFLVNNIISSFIIIAITIIVIVAIVINDPSGFQFL